MLMMVRSQGGDAELCLQAKLAGFIGPTVAALTA